MEKLEKRKRVLIALGVAGVLFLAGLVYSYLNPGLSWNPNIRDSDRDGFSDATDSSPHDPAVHEWADGSVNVTIPNGLNGTVRFTIFSTFDGVHVTLQSYTDIEAGGTETSLFSVKWPDQGTPANLTIHVSALPWASNSSGPMLWDNHTHISDGLTAIFSVEYPVGFRSPGEPAAVSQMLNDTSDSRR